MRIVFIGTVKFSQQALLKLIAIKAHITGVITKEKSDFNADFTNLSSICIKNHIPFIYTENINSENTIKWIKSLEPDIIFCFGWSSLLKQEVLNLAPIGVIGFHPTELPKNRGRHPLIWALALGLEKTASTFFFMDEGADTGDILSQVPINIEYEDDAFSLYQKITLVALDQIEKFHQELKNNTFKRVPQDHLKTNLWRKRSKLDGLIDFRMSSSAIYNLTRALTKPYVGAHLLYKGSEIKIWKVKEVNFPKNNIEPGKILDINEDKILVKVYDNAIEIIEHEFVNLPTIGEYL